MRFNEDIISLWNRNADAADGTVQKLQGQMRRLMRLPQFISMEYKRHETSLTDKSSFRNTQVWRSGDAGLPPSGNSPAGAPPQESGGMSPPLAPAVSAMFSSVPSGPPLAVNARWSDAAPGGGGGGGGAGGGGFGPSSGGGGGMGNVGGPAKVWGKEGAPSGLPPARDLNSKWR